MSARSEPSVRRCPGMWGAVLYVCCYVLLDWISYIYPAVPPLAVTPWNPPPGLSLALLLRCGPRNAPWVFVAVLAAELLVRGLHLPIFLLLGIAALVTAAYTLLAVVLKRLDIETDFTRLRDAVIFLIAGAITTGLLAIATVGIWHEANLLGSASVAMVMAQFWIGDFLGIVVMTPLLLVVTRRPPPRLRLISAEATVHLTAILVAIWLIFGSGLAQDLKLFYVLFLPVIWIAMRRGLEGAVIATAVIQVCMVLTMWIGHYHAETVFDFQFLLLAIAGTGLFLGLTVSERQEVSAQLRLKQEELDRSLRLAGASEMASALAHELNQPLAAINNYVKACQLMLARPGESSEVLRDTMDKVVVESARAGSVVRKLRDFFRSGTSRFEPTAVEPLLRAAVDSVRQRLERHHVVCRVEIMPDLPDAQADRLQIEMVLHNLVSNAIDALKAGPAGERRITITAAPLDARMLRISVTDNGPGIAPEVAPRLFSPFLSSKPDGMGLGLAICRSIIAAHGGRLWHEDIGQDTVFRFTLPQAVKGTS